MGLVNHLGLYDFLEVGHRWCLHRSKTKVDIELDGLLGLTLNDGGTLPSCARDEENAHFELHNVTATQLAVDGHVEEGEIAGVDHDLEAHADRPDVLWLKLALLADDAAFVPSRGVWQERREGDF